MAHVVPKGATVPRRRRRLTDSKLRALARAEPSRLLSLVHVLVPGLLPLEASVTPDDVDDTHLDLPGRERVVDFVVRVGQTELLHVEFHAYRSKRFRTNLLDYEVGLVNRYPQRKVKTVVLWLINRDTKRLENEISFGSVTLHVNMVVLPKVSADRLLQDPRLACFAAGADGGAWSNDEHCRRVADTLVKERATRRVWEVATALAVIRKRYHSWRKAMKKSRIKKAPILDEIYIGAYRSGRHEGREEGREEGLGEGLVQGLHKAIVSAYKARIGAIPTDTLDVIKSMHDPGTLLEWLQITVTQPPTTSLRGLDSFQRASRRPRCRASIQTSISSIARHTNNLPRCSYLSIQVQGVLLMPPLVFALRRAA